MNRPWYYRSWFILPLLFFCLPIGLVFMWLGKRYPLWARWTLTGVFGLFWLVIIISPNNSSNLAEPEFSSTISRKQRPSSENIEISEKHLIASKQTEQKKPIEYTLAFLEKEGILEENDITIARFRALLELLSGKFVESKIEIADATVTAQNLLREQGIEESLLNMMEGINRIFYQNLENQSYVEYITLYITMRVQGETHQQSINGLTAALQSMLTR